jgi:hypothetical protein
MRISLLLLCIRQEYPSLARKEAVEEEAMTKATHERKRHSLGQLESMASPTDFHLRMQIFTGNLCLFYNPD